MIGPPSTAQSGNGITAALGAGGMGEVCRATDTNLGRDVAIKVLPSEVAQDAERLGRFKQEAHLLAALNHPHIAAIHGLEEVDGSPSWYWSSAGGGETASREPGPPSSTRLPRDLPGVARGVAGILDDLAGVPVVEDLVVVQRTTWETSASKARTWVSSRLYR